MAIKHTVVKIPGQRLFAVADWNIDHTVDSDVPFNNNKITGLKDPTLIQDAATKNYVDTVAVGEANTASNTGSAGTGVFKQKVGVDLEFFKLNSVNNLLTIGLDGADKIDLTINEGNISHDAIADVSADDHHLEIHNAVSHSDIASTGAQIDGAVGASHARQHAITTAADHTSTATPAQMLKADANGLPIDATNTDAQVSGAVTASHAKQHAITTAADHTSTATPGKILEADANGLPIDATNTDVQVAAAVTASHTQNTDTALGAGCEADDHGAAATDQVINVCYGVGAPPAANTTTEGTLFVKYTA